MILLLLSIFFFYIGLFCILKDYILFLDFNLINIYGRRIIITLLIDYKSLLFISFVLIISSLVIYYRKMYMLGDNNLSRFIIIILLFVLSIIFLILSPNLIRILLGWDGLGLVSYCLVIYFHNVKSYNAGILTALSNRIGDVAFLLAISWSLNYGGWNYIFILLNKDNFIGINYILGLIIVAGLTKRAQIPFSSWLPAAIAAPTPVSALVHSSTLVTAGVYLIIRFGNLINNGLFCTLLLFIGGITILIAGLGANFEYDLRKIIALSTLSQLGLIIGTIGLGYFDLAYFHILIHALFKDLLFLCAGCIIHLFNDTQDIRKIGGVIWGIPLISVCFLVSNLCLCGIPFLSGFYSKDLILEICLINNFNLYMLIVFFLSTGLTVCYTFRLIYYVIKIDYNYGSLYNISIEELGFLLPIFMLILMSVIGGSIISWLMFPTPYLVILSMEFKMLVLLVRRIGGWIGYILSNIKRYVLIIDYKLIITFLGSIWFIPYISTNIIIKNPLWCGLLLRRNLDGGWTEEIGAQGLYNYIIIGRSINQYLQNNLFKIYLIRFYLWLIFFLLLSN